MMKRFNFFDKRPAEKGQGLVEYALILVMVAVVVIAVLMVLGPAVSEVYCKVTNGLQPGSCVAGGSGVITAVFTAPAGPNIKVVVTVSQNVTVSASITAGSGTLNQTSKNCSGSCQFIIQSPSPNGTVTISDGNGSMSASW